MENEQEGLAFAQLTSSKIDKITPAFIKAQSEMEAPKLDKINPGQWFGKRFAEELGAEKVLVQKSGYFSRSAPANGADLTLIRACINHAVDAALRGEAGVVGQDEERDDELRVIEFERIKGGKAFDVSLPWFTEMLTDLGQE